MRPSGLLVGRHEAGPFDGVERVGLIRYRCSVVTILDRRGLRQGACECYGLSKREFDRLLDDPSHREAPPRKAGSRHA